MIKNILKFCFAGAIIAWLLKSGKLDFTLITQSFQQGYYWLAALTIIALNALMSTYRWKILLEIKAGTKLPYLPCVKLTWIGLFFNSFLPGAVTGDFIKLLYAKDLNKELSKTFLITSVLMDRVIGLIGLLILVGIFSMISYSEVIQISPQISNLMVMNFLLFIGVVLFLVTLFLPTSIQNIFLNLSLKIPVLGDKVHHTLEQVWLIGKAKVAVIQCLFISFLCQFLNVLTLYVLAYQFIGDAVPLTHAFTFIPIGFIAVAIPIAPAGLGVGHVAFETLFGYFNIKGGASYFNLLFLLMIFVNLLGVFPYLFSGKKHTLAEASEFEKSTS